MNITLLRRRNGAEWSRCYDQLWMWAISAARRSLFRNVYSEEDREDVAKQGIIEFQRALCRGKIRRCRDERDVQHWIWGRTLSRALDLRRKRRREGRLLQFNRQAPLGEQNEGRGDGQERAADALVERQPISNEARVNELIAWARLLAPGFSRQEESAYRAVVVRGLTEKEYAEESGIPPGTVAGYVSSAKRKIAAVLELERQMFL